MPRCCSVITDILKQQRKKITLGTGRISAGESVLAAAPLGLDGCEDLAAGGEVVSQEGQGEQ